MLIHRPRNSLTAHKQYLKVSKKEINFLEDKGVKISAIDPKGLRLADLQTRLKPGVWKVRCCKCRKCYLKNFMVANGRGEFACRDTKTCKSQQNANGFTDKTPSLTPISNLIPENDTDLSND